MNAGSAGYNIVILPSEEIKRQVISWSEQIEQKYKVKFVLDGKTYHPHVTLYQSNFPEEQYSVLFSKLTEIAKKSTPFSLSFTTIAPYVDFIFYNAVKDPSLQSLHETILSAVAPLHDPAFALPPDLQGFPPNLAENIKTYGSALVLADFLPHITLSRCLTTDDAMDATKRFPPISTTMTVDALYLTNVDHDGTCTKILEKFEFNK